MKKIIIFLSIFVFTFNPLVKGNAEDSDISIYPIPAIFVLKNEENKTFYNNYIKNRADFVKQFLEIFNSTYPNSIREISDKNKYKTFAVYVNVPRATQSFYKRGEVLDIYLPTTASINFVNMATSEILYSFPLTEYGGFSTSIEKAQDINYVNEQITKNYNENYKHFISDIVVKSAEKFKPFKINAKVKDTYRNLYILDKGLTAGISKGDLLTDKNDDQIVVIYSSLNYSVAKPLLGKPAIINAIFNKYSNSTISQLKKPKLLFINDFDNEKFYNIFSTELGSNASFSLMTVDKTFYKMQNDLATLNMNFSSKNSQTRELPDYFLKLYLSKPVYTIYPSNKEDFSMDKFSLFACGTIFDKSGRVVFSRCTDDEITDNVVSDIKFSTEAREEVLTKNVLNKLANIFANEVKFKNITLKIKKVNDDKIFIKDKNGILQTDSTVSIFKKIKTEKCGEEILIPTWEYRISSIEKDIAEAKVSQLITDGMNYPSKRDRVLITKISGTDNHTNMLKYVSENNEIKGNQVKIDNFSDIAFAALAENLKTPISFNQNDLTKELQKLNEGYGFKKIIEIPFNYSEMTIKPVYKIELLESNQDHNSIRQKYKVVVGLVSRNGENVIKRSGTKQELELSIPDKNDTERIQFELQKSIMQMIKELAKEF